MNINRLFLTLLAIILLFPVTVMANEIKVQAGKVTVTSSSDGGIEVNTGSTEINVPPDELSEAELSEDDLELEIEEWESELLEEDQSIQYQYSSCNGNGIQSNHQTARTTGSGKITIQRNVSHCP